MKIICSVFDLESEDSDTKSICIDISCNDSNMLDEKIASLQNNVS